MKPPARTHRSREAGLREPLKSQHAALPLAAIVAASNDAIVCKDLEGQILAWNPAAERIFGYSAEEAVGQSIRLIIPPDRLHEEEQIIESMRRGQPIEELETTRLAKGGRPVKVAITVAPIRDAAGNIIGAVKVARDLTARRQAERRLRRRDRALRKANAKLRAQAADLIRFNQAAVGRELRMLELKGQVNELLGKFGEPPRYALELEEPAAPPPSASKPEALVPLERILRTEELQSRPSRPPDYEAENRALAALMCSLAESPRAILQTLAERVLEVLNAGSAGLSLLTDAGERFYWAAIAGAWAPHLGGGTPREFGPCGDVLDCDAPLLFTHWEHRYPYLAAATPLAEEGLLVPFRVAGQAVGTIWAISHDPARSFEREDLRLLESLGRFAALAYQAVELLGAEDARRATLSLLEDAVQAGQQAEDTNRQLKESERQHAIEADALSRLNELSSRLWSSRDMHQGLDAMLAAVIELLGADTGDVQLLDGRGVLTIAAHRGLEQRFLDCFREVSVKDECACARALRSGQLMAVEDVEADESYEHYRPTFRSAGLRAVVSIPLASGDSTLHGMLSTHFRQPHRPSDTQVRRLILYARQASDFIYRCKIEQMLQGREQELRESDRRKNEFLALLGHELRNPLTPIRNASELLARVAGKDARALSAIDMIKRQTAQLVTIVDDLLRCRAHHAGAHPIEGRAARARRHRHPSPREHRAAAAREAAEDLDRDLHRGATVCAGRFHAARAVRRERPLQRQQVHRSGRGNPHRDALRGRHRSDRGERYRHRNRSRPAAPRL